MTRSARIGGNGAGCGKDTGLLLGQHRSDGDVVLPPSSSTFASDSIGRGSRVLDGEAVEPVAAPAFDSDASKSSGRVLKPSDRV